MAGLGSRRQEVCDACDLLVDRRTARAAVCAPRRLDVLQRHHLAGVLLAHRATEKPIAVKDSDLSKVARVVPDGDGVANVGGERRVAVSQTLKTDAIALHDTRPGVHDEQQVEVFEAVGKARQEAMAAPGVERRLSRLAVNARVMVR